MNTEQLQNWLQIVGLTGVIVSLMFVGFEIQQSRQIAIADVYQQRTGLLMQASISMYSPEQYNEAHAKRESGVELDSRDKRIVDIARSVWMAYFENNHFQNQLGLLPDEHWQSARNGLRGILQSESVREWWETNRDLHRVSFAAEVDQLIQETLTEE